MNERNDNINESIEERIEREIEIEREDDQKQYKEQSRELDQLETLFKRDNLIKNDLVDLCKKLKPLRYVPDLFKELISEGYYLEQDDGFQLSNRYTLFIQLVEFLAPQFPFDLPQKKLTKGAYAAEKLPALLHQLSLNMEKDSKGLIYAMPLDEMSEKTGVPIKDIKHIIGQFDATSKYFKFHGQAKEYIRLSGFNLRKLFDFFKLYTVNKNLIKHLIIVSLFYNVDPHGEDYSDHFNLLLSFNTCAIIAIG